MKRKIYIYLISGIMMMLLSSCSEKGTESVPVSGDEQQTTTEVVESSTGESATQDNDTQENATVGEENRPTEEQSTEEQTTEDEQPAINYIYEQITDDAEVVKALGNVDVTEDELTELTHLVEAYGKHISFKAVSVDGTKGISYNSQGEYFAASAIKAPYLLYCYKQMDDGNGTLDETMEYSSKYYRGGTGDIKNSAEGTVYTLQEIMRRVIWNSDNSGYYMCTERWGKEGYNRLMEEMGCERLKLPSSSSIWVYEVKAEDFIIAWKHIYDYFEIGTQHSQVFYESTTNCKWSFFGSGIQGKIIAQKYGWADASYCDAGIVYGDNSTYLLSVFTDFEGSSEEITFVSKVVKAIDQIMDR